MPLVIKNLCKQFDGKVIFQNFSYDFPDKGIVLIVGNSGRGKTTLLRMIAGLDKDFTGEITSLPCSYAFQEYRLFPTLNVLENVTKILYENPSKDETEVAKKLLKSLFFSDADLQLFPSALSGGMKQRVSLCRAILAKKDVLLLDEPFKELDTDLRSRIRDLIKKEAEKRLVIMTAHSKDTLGDLAHTAITL